MGFLTKNVVSIKRFQPATRAQLENVVRRKKEALESYRACFPHIETESAAKKESFSRFVNILLTELQTAERNLAEYKDPT